MNLMGLEYRYKLFKCPVSGGLKTRITEDGFNRACSIIRNKRRLNGQRMNAQHEICATCSGRKPKEVTFVKLEDF